MLVVYFGKVFGYAICWCSYGWHNSSRDIALFPVMSFYRITQSWLYRIWQIYLETYLQTFFLFLVGVIFSQFCWWNLNVGSSSAIFALFSCSSIFGTSLFYGNTANLEPLSSGWVLVSFFSLFILIPFFVVLRDCSSGHS